MMYWNDPAVQAAMIQSIGTIVATLFAAITAAIIGKRISDRDKLKENLDVAIGDVAFLLYVENEHCRVNKEKTARTSKLVIRRLAEESGLKWSGRFTPGRAKSLFKDDVI